eukprot:1238776-Ditylum_brightwellii.AAC.1
MPGFIEYSPSDKEDHITHQYGSDFDSIDGDGLDNRKIPAQIPRNEIENMVTIEHGGGNLNVDDNEGSFLIQDVIEHNLVQSSWED